MVIVHTDREKQAPDLKIAVRRLIGFIEKNSINVIVLEGRSARPIADLFKPAWQKLNPGKPMPRIFSLGNRLKKFAGLKMDGIDSLTSSCELGDPKIISKFDVEGLRQELSKEMPSLMQNRNKNILLLTELMATGNSLLAARQLLAKIGFSHVTSAAMFRQHQKKPKGIVVFGRECDLPFFYGWRKCDPKKNPLPCYDRKAQMRGLRKFLRQTGAAVKTRRGR